MPSVISTIDFFLDFDARCQIQTEDNGKDESCKNLTTMILRKEQHNDRIYHVSGELLCEGPQGGVADSRDLESRDTVPSMRTPGSLEQFLFVEGQFLSSSYPVSQRVAEEEISLAKVEPWLHQWRASDSSTVFRAPNQSFGSDGPAFGIVSVLL